MANNGLVLRAVSLDDIRGWLAGEPLPAPQAPDIRIGDLTHGNVTASDWTLHNDDISGFTIFTVTNAGGVTVECLRLAQTGVIVNEGSANLDFRVESDDEANCFKVEGSNNNVGLGIGLPLARLHLVDGSVLLGQSGAAPSGATDAAGIYTLDVTGTAELFGYDEAGNDTQLTPHTFKLFEPDPDAEYPWSYYGLNRYLGIEINVDMWAVVRAVEELTGKTLMHLRNIPRQSWPHQKPMPDWLEERIRDPREARIVEEAAG